MCALILPAVLMFLWYWCRHRQLPLTKCHLALPREESWELLADGLLADKDKTYFQLLEELGACKKKKKNLVLNSFGGKKRKRERERERGERERERNK